HCRPAKKSDVCSNQKSKPPCEIAEPVLLKLDFVVYCRMVVRQRQFMLTDYIQRAMRHAHYEVMENGRFFGSIPECRGVWGEGVTLEECREELEGALDAWIIAA